jgi:hypothetical protein
MNLIYHRHVAPLPRRLLASPAVAPVPKPLGQARRHRSQADGRNHSLKHSSFCSPS